jgi:hypothetical protein
LRTRRDEGGRLEVEVGVKRERQGDHSLDRGVAPRGVEGPRGAGVDAGVVPIVGTTPRSEGEPGWPWWTGGWVTR